jgi:hypothetical protein
MARKPSLIVAALALACAAGSAFAGPIPYPNPGTLNPAVYTFTATTTGDLTAWFLGNGGAGLESTLGLLVNGVDTGIDGLNNHTSAYGETLDFGNVHAGDVLVFKLNVTSPGWQNTWYTDKSLNWDGVQHGYATSYPGDAQHGIPAGAYLGMEDLPGFYLGLTNYTDLQVALSNVSGVPEPTGLALLLTGLGVLGVVARRQRCNG